MQLPPLVNHDRVLAHVSWNTADETMQDERNLKAARTALQRYMRKKHPGKKFRVIQSFSLDGKLGSWMAVPLDG